MELSHTVAERIGHAMEPAIKPLGFDWRIGTAMMELPPRRFLWRS